MTVTDHTTRLCKTVVLKEYVESGIPGPEHFTIEESRVGSIVNDGDLLLDVAFMSADPYLRSSLKKGSPRGRSPGEAMVGFVVGKVLESKNEKWAVGAYMGANLPFSSVQIVTSAQLKTTYSWDLTSHVTAETLSLGLSVLGMPGATAYGGLIDVLRPNDKAAEKETLFVSAAAGAVGGIVGQLAKNVYGLHTIGSCGGAAKVDHIKNNLGFDAGIDYKAAEGNADKLTKLLKDAAPKGIDMYYENVGGIHLEAAFANLRPHGRIAICGMISQYNDKVAALNKLPLMNAIYTFQRIEGFVCAPWLTGMKGNFLADMSKWVKEGKIKTEETFFEGVDQWPLAFQSLFSGEKLGKVVVRV